MTSHWSLGKDHHSTLIMNSLSNNYRTEGTPDEEGSAELFMVGKSEFDMWFIAQLRIESGIKVSRSPAIKEV